MTQKARRTAKSRKSRALEIRVVRLDHARDLPLPDYQSAGAAGLDLLAAVGAGQVLRLAPGGFLAVPTGLQLEIPDGFEAQVRPRSGLAVKHGVTVLNSPGTIDSDYRGEVKVILINLGKRAFVVRRGERIAQMVIHKVERAAFVEAKALTRTERSTGGFGSTGTAARPRASKRPRVAKKTPVPEKRKLVKHSRRSASRSRTVRRR